MTSHCSTSSPTPLYLLTSISTTFGVTRSNVTTSIFTKLRVHNVQSHDVALLDVKSNATLPLDVYIHNVRRHKIQCHDIHLLGSRVSASTTLSLMTSHCSTSSPTPIYLLMSISTTFGVTRSNVTTSIFTKLRVHNVQSHDVALLDVKSNSNLPLDVYIHNVRRHKIQCHDIHLHEAEGPQRSVS
ncbi:hypothetical protein J6590_062202 [Homalodisca vitripennis]|nr:hypothetical protein J6590_062202 [Homalodisca vitripennis]